MLADFTITAEPERDLIRISMRGFFDADAIARFVEVRALEHAKLRCGPNQHLTLNDIREMKIQSQDVVARFHALLADPAYRSRKLAFVVASSLARMQLIRAVGERHATYFTSIAEAEAWLFDDRAQRAA